MLNRQGPNKIDWTDYTWNPISGCLHGCRYCYLQRMERRFPGMLRPALKEKTLYDPLRLKTPSKIFAGSAGDMWGAWVPYSWIERVLDVAANSGNHLFQFLTKNPARYGDFGDLTENMWFGTTVDGSRRTADNNEQIKLSVRVPRRFISFEPILGPVNPYLRDIQWVIIGADSTPGAKKPHLAWAYGIIDEARRRGVPVWVKDNFGYPGTIKEVPAEMVAK